MGGVGGLDASPKAAPSPLVDAQLPFATYSERVESVGHLFASALLMPFANANGCQWTLPMALGSRASTSQHALLWRPKPFLLNAISLYKPV